MARESKMVSAPASPTVSLPTAQYKQQRGLGKLSKQSSGGDVF